MGWKLKRIVRHPGSAIVHGGKKVVKEVLKNGVSVGVGASGGNLSANAKIGRVPVANVPIKTAPRPIPNKVPQKPIPTKPPQQGCYGVQPKRITTNYPKLETESYVTLNTKMSGLVGSYVGESKQCVALVKALFGSLGATPQWKKGVQVKNNASIKPGTPIATFGKDGTYLNATDGSSHAAIFCRFVNGGFEVFDQWDGQPVHRRTIRYKNGQGTANNDGDQYHVIIKKP